MHYCTLWYTRSTTGYTGDGIGCQRESLRRRQAPGTVARGVQTSRAGGKAGSMSIARRSSLVYAVVGSESANASAQARLLAGRRRRARGRGLALLRVVAQGVDELGEDGRRVCVRLEGAAAGLGSLGRDGSGLGDHCGCSLCSGVRRSRHDGEVCSVDAGDQEQHGSSLYTRAKSLYSPHEQL